MQGPSLSSGDQLRALPHRPLESGTDARSAIAGAQQAILFWKAIPAPSLTVQDRLWPLYSTLNVRSMLSQVLKDWGWGELERFNIYSRAVFSSPKESVPSSTRPSMNICCAWIFDWGHSGAWDLSVYNCLHILGPKRGSHRIWWGYRRWFDMKGFWNIAWM